MGLLGIDHAVIRVKDLDRTLDWYRAGLGLEERERADGVVYLACGGDDHFDLALKLGGAGLENVAFRIRDGAALEELRRRLDQEGVESRWLDPGRKPGVGEAIELALPSGHRMEVAVLVGAEPRYLHTTEWSRGAVHAPVDFNHVTFLTRSPRRFAEFMRDKLGFMISDYVAADGEAEWPLAFIRTQENHHDFALLASDADRLHHVAFLLKSTSEIQDFCDRIARLGHGIEYGIGRHGPGNNIFCYLRDPSGNRVELTAEMARVTDPNTPPRRWTGNMADIVNVWGPVLPPPSFAEGT
jgi:catechol 2,3-dioxygenase